MISRLACVAIGLVCARRAELGSTRIQYKGLALASFVLFASWQFIYAQTSTGSLRGEVQDNDGRRIPAATVTVEAPGSALKKVVRASKSGEFRLDDLLPGPYQVIVGAPGFAETRDFKSPSNLS